MNQFTAFPIPNIDIPSLPDVSPVTDTSQFIMERAGTGRVPATAIAAYTNAAITYTAIGAGAVTRTLRDRLGDLLSVKDFGAVGDDATDDTLAINAAIAAAVAQKKTVFFPAGTYMVSDQGNPWCVYNAGASMLGEGHGLSVIAPSATTSASADIVCIAVPAGGDLSFLSIENLMVYPAAYGSPRGRRGIYFNFNAPANLAALHIQSVFCAPGNDYSLYLDNNPAVNPQGVPANSVIEDSYFWEGVRAVYIGDSVTLRNCTMRGAAGAFRHGVEALIQTGTGGIASHFIIEKCNMDCPGAAIWIHNGRNVKILHNNIESSYGVGSSSNAVIDLDGLSGAIIMPEIKGNAIGMFGTTTAQWAIRVNSAVDTDIDNNTLICGMTMTGAILVNADASNTYIGGYNEIGPQFTNKFLNGGVGTRGIRIPLTLANGFTNVGAGSPPASYWQAKDGVVTLEGLVNCPATPNTVTMATLPAAAWPPTNRRFPAYAVVSSTISPQGIVVYADGSVQYTGSNTATQVSLDGICFPTNTGISGNL